ncbi:hypothetical protein JN350_06480 [Curtobacterium sp. 24E2]|nr:hypothetical protein JN350_06480 [Curtobacterium sp. 24E2]
MFWTTQFGQVLKAAGEPAIADTAQVTQGSLEERSAVVTFGRDGRLVAAVAVNQSKWLPYYRAQIESGAAFPSKTRRSIPPPTPGCQRRGSARHRPKPIDPTRSRTR